MIYGFDESTTRLQVELEHQQSALCVMAEYLNTWFARDSRAARGGLVIKIILMMLNENGICIMVSNDCIMTFASA